MTRDEILALPSMPPGNPSYPRGPYRFIDREYFVVIYESDAAAIRRMVPEPLEPDGSDGGPPDDDGDLVPRRGVKR